MQEQEPKEDEKKKVQFRTLCNWVKQSRWKFLTTHCPRSTEFQFREWLLIYYSCKLVNWGTRHERSTHETRKEKKRKINLNLINQGLGSLLNPSTKITSLLCLHAASMKYDFWFFCRTWSLHFWIRNRLNNNRMRWLVTFLCVHKAAKARQGKVSFNNNQLHPISCLALVS